MAFLYGKTVAASMVNPCGFGAGDEQVIKPGWKILRFSHEKTWWKKPNMGHEKMWENPWTIFFSRNFQNCHVWLPKGNLRGLFQAVFPEGTNGSAGVESADIEHNRLKRHAIQYSLHMTYERACKIGCFRFSSWDMCRISLSYGAPNEPGWWLLFCGDPCGKVTLLWLRAVPRSFRLH